MRILITGGAGYLGAVITPVFLREGHEVTVLDTFMYNQSSLLDCCHYPQLKVIRGDTRDKNLIAQLMKECDAVFPLACLTGAPLCDRQPQDAEEIVVNALKMILGLRSKDQIIIYPTTNSGYGVGEKGKFCTEETPLRPISLYGRIKVQAEQMVLDAGNAVTLRLATAFGVSPRMRLDLLVNDFTFRAVFEHRLELFEAHFKRNFIHVRDVAKAFLHMVNNFDKVKDQTYNVGLSDANLSKLELCQEIKKFIPDLEIIESNQGEDPDKRDYIVSNEKIESTGYKPDVSLSDGIQELIKCFRVIDYRKSIESRLTNV
ncbi:MAG: NAD(P)-dependent oxidoreductase [Candidatus Omnitrophica bacterium]|nr:NAD(P)-dependent oxidoreductase [Candidatus Omnitrophota bacterium]MCB9747385.1 NAD(P)-dependent oxidoreductase [Candidatus Omnitrophota bacterium]